MCFLPTPDAFRGIGSEGLRQSGIGRSERSEDYSEPRRVLQESKTVKMMRSKSKAPPPAL